MNFVSLFIMSGLANLTAMSITNKNVLKCEDCKYFIVGNTTLKIFTNPYRNYDKYMSIDEYFNR